MKNLVMIILLVNTLIGLAFLLSCLFMKTGSSRFSTVLYGLLIIFCPVLGPLTVLGIAIARKLLPAKKIDLSDVSFSHEKHGMDGTPDEEEEMKITPLQDMFLVGNNIEKRQALFFVLKQDIDRYLGTISQGIANDDSETSHYAATSLMKYQADFTKKVQQIAVLYEQDPADYEVNRAYADVVLRYLSTGVEMSEMDRKKNQYLYCSLMENLADNYESKLEEQDYKNVIGTYLELQDADHAGQWVRDCWRTFPDREGTYLNELEYYMRTGQNREFVACLGRLKGSDIPLSAQSVNLIRFFTKNSVNA